MGKDDGAFAIHDGYIRRVQFNRMFMNALLVCSVIIRVSDMNYDDGETGRRVIRDLPDSLFPANYSELHLRF